MYWGSSSKHIRNVRVDFEQVFGIERMRHVILARHTTTFHLGKSYTSLGLQGP